MADILGFPHGFNGHGTASAGAGITYPSEVNPNEPDPPPVNPEAVAILEDAYKLIEGDRHQHHGAASKCHGEIAKLWTWWTGIQIDAHDVAIMLALMKISRVKTGGYNRDTYTDLCGYGSLAGQLRKTEATPR